MGLVEQIGFRAIELINKQIEKGIDMDGNAYHYSTKPFAMPAKKNLPGKKALVKEGRLVLFTSKKGKLWQLVMGGYKDWRQINKRNPEGDFLNWSGSMLKSITSKVGADEPYNKRSILYFASAVEAKKAFWLTVSGAGKSRKLWKFWGLTNESLDKLLIYAKDLAAQDQEIASWIINRFKIMRGVR